jgi:chemotaxis protein CheD
MMVVVGVSDCRVSASADDVLITYALGSCIAVVLHDPVARVGGLLHYMLPDSALDRAKAGQSPSMFADTGIPLLLSKVAESGGQRRRLVVRLAGGAQVVNDGGVFDIGKRNYLAARKLLWKAGMMVRAEEVGGNIPRTVRLDVASGKVWLRSGGVDSELVGDTSVKGGPLGLSNSDRR